jgi:hypothetical protein
MKTVSMQDLLEIYRQKNHCRDIVEARTKLEKVGRDMYEHPDTEVSIKGEYLLLRLQEWDEQQANTPPPPKQKPYATPQTNGANQAPPQTNTATTPTDDYTLLHAFARLAAFALAVFSIFAGLYALGGAIVNSVRGIADGIAAAAIPVGKFICYLGACGIGLLGLKEFFTKKETPTAPNGPAGITVNHHYYGSGVVTNEQK